MTPVSKRPIPEGYKDNHNSNIWNIGNIFKWSEAFGEYVHMGHVSVAPNQSLPEAFERVMGKRMTLEYEIFFIGRKDETTI